MQTRDKISKASWMLLDSVKAALTQNTMAAAQQLQLDNAKIERLLSIVVASADEGYHKSHNAFMRGVDAALDSHGSEDSRSKKPD